MSIKGEDFYERYSPILFFIKPSTLIKLPIDDVLEIVCCRGSAIHRFYNKPIFEALPFTSLIGGKAVRGEVSM